MNYTVWYPCKFIPSRSLSSSLTPTIYNALHYYLIYNMTSSYYNTPVNTYYNHMQPYTPTYSINSPDNELLYQAHTKLLNEIKDKSLILSVLCSKSATLFSRIRTFINIPLILSSGAMTILNSMNDTDSTYIKYANIVLNSCTVTILSIIGNFKLTERELSYRNTHLKMKRLYHRVDTILRVDITKINTQKVGEITKDYLHIYEHLEFPIPHYISKKFNNDIANISTFKNNTTNPLKYNKNPHLFDANLTFADNVLNNNFPNIVI